MGVHDDVGLGLIQTRVIPTTWPPHAVLKAVRLQGTLPLGCINMPRKNTSNATCGGGQLRQMLHAAVLRQYVWQMLHAGLRQYVWQMLHAVLRQYVWQMLHIICTHCSPAVLEANASHNMYALTSPTVLVANASHNMHPILQQYL